MLNTTKCGIFLSCLEFAILNSLYREVILKPKQVMYLEKVFLNSDTIPILPSGYIAKSLIFCLLPALLFAKTVRKQLSQRSFIFKKWIGEGGVARVARVMSSLSHRRYAIKVYDVTKDENYQNYIKHVRQEIEALQELQKGAENIVYYYTTWSYTDLTKEVYFIQLELCSMDLKRYIYLVGNDGHKRICAQKLSRPYVHIFPQLLNALAHMHKLNLVHRDLHLGNILVARTFPQEIRDIAIKVADFGHTRKVGVHEHEQLSPGIGDGVFSAPELITGQYDHKVDLYSSGIVLYSLSCILPEEKDLHQEIKQLKLKNRYDKKYFHYKDDNILFELIVMLLDEDPNKRLNADEILMKLLEQKHQGRYLSSSAPSM